jgi:hypothetical protein
LSTNSKCNLVFSEINPEKSRNPEGRVLFGNNAKLYEYI